MAEQPTMTVADANAMLTAPGQMFEIEELEIHGVRTRVWKGTPPTLRAVFDMTLGHGDATFLVYEDERISFAEHYRQAATLACRLRDVYGIETGDRVGIAMRNLPEWVIAFWAAAAAGAVVVPLNAWWTGDELAYGLENSGSKVAFVDTERAGLLAEYVDGLASLETLVVTDEARRESPGARSAKEIPFAEALGVVAPDATPPDVEIGPDDDATIFYTSGTTGRPKGAVGTHRNICTNLMNLFFLNVRASTRYGSGLTGGAGGGQNAQLLSVPFFHVTGCHSMLVANTAVGGKLVMMRRFDAERALELIEREKISAFGGVPAMVMQVLDSPKFAQTDTSSIRSVAYGGAPCPPDLVRRIKEHFPVAQPSNGYGLTETSSVTSANSGKDYEAKPESVGPPVPVTEVAIVPENFDGDEPNPGRPQGPDVQGELWVKGPQVVRGYWNRAEESAQVFTKGWLHTGDVARLDEEGFIYIVDRAKDVIIRGGENVYSVEVEAALFEHDAVADCAVIGIPHPVLGEEVGAVVVLRPGAEATESGLAAHVRERLAGFKVPAHFFFREEPLPRNPAGKVLKRALRSDVLTEA